MRFKFICTLGLVSQPKLMISAMFYLSREFLQAAMRNERRTAPGG